MVDVGRGHRGEENVETLVEGEEVQVVSIGEKRGQREKELRRVEFDFLTRQGGQFVSFFVGGSEECREPILLFDVHVYVININMPLFSDFSWIILQILTLLVVSVN